MKNFFFFFLSIIFHLPSFSQSSNFVTFGVEEGLIQSHVQTLQQDNEGNLWIGTIGGLTKYNGTKFANYTQEDGLSEDWITVSLKDRNGNIWFGHWGGGLSVYDFYRKKFVDLKSENFTNYKKITSLAEDSSGNVYAGTEGAGIAMYGEFHKLVFDSASHSGKPEMIEISGITNAIFADNENRLWLGTDNGILVYDIPSKKILGTFNSSNGFPANSVQSIIQPTGNEIWFGTDNSGIIRLQKDKISFSGFSENSFQKIDTVSGLSSNNIKTMFDAQEKIVWIGTKNAGINQFISSENKDESGFTKGAVNIFSNKFEMKYYNPNVFLQDREENIWLGTEIGLHRYTGELFRIYNYNDGLPGNLVWSILSDSKSNLWFSTSDGVSKFTFPSADGKIQYNNSTVKNYTVADGLPENLVASMYEDSKGNIWFGTQSSGVAVLMEDEKTEDGRPKMEDRKKKTKNQKPKTENQFQKISVREGLADNNIYSISEDKEGNIWFGTRNGASRLNPETKEIKNFSSADGLGGDKVYKIFRDSKNNLWFGILGGYLTKYDGKEFKTFNLNQKFILTMDEDKNGNLWFGGYGGGILKYDGNDFKNFTVENGLSSNSPLFVVCDDENNVWLGQSRGIEKYDAQTQRFSLYSRQQGFPGVETNDNAVAKDKDQNIWFSTIKGAVKFSPKKEKISQTEPLTSITSLKLFLKEIPLKNEFSYNENYLTFSALAVCLTNPKDVLYQYKLEGFDVDWLSPTQSNSVVYSNLPPGKYSFMVKASNGEKVWNAEPVIHTFSIFPPFWETWWFRIAALVFVATVVILVVKWRERTLQKEKKILAARVAERTLELRKEKETVEKQNVKITESISYAKRIQQAVLPSIETVQKTLPDSFIFYKPKDIVSGDFYWIYKKENKTLFAAVDCTGHGVPGALMSIIGHNILEQIVSEHQTTEPAAILNLLAKEVAQTLGKSSTATIKDGMDIALCCLDIQLLPKSLSKGEGLSSAFSPFSFGEGAGVRLQFAGAGNSLYIINPKRNSWPQNSVRFQDNLPGAEIKADKQSIGAQTDNVPFTNHAVQLEKGDMLYIFSDGFADQKGGTDKKKFYYAPFRKLLCEMYDLPAAEQRKKLKETILQWMGNMEQYDDMLIFGVRI